MEYERIADAYDHELAGPEDCLSPAAVAAVCLRVLARDARVLDVGAGTGLLGVALAARLHAARRARPLAGDARRGAAEGRLQALPTSEPAVLVRVWAFRVV
jgi:precorrin-6B methylase 2